ALSRAPALEPALENADRSADFSLVDGMRAPLLATLLSARPRALMVVSPTSREGDLFGRAVRAYLPEATVVEFPAWETLPHERLSPSAETVGRRLAAIRALTEYAAGADGAGRGSGGGGSAQPLILIASV